ncbi:sensor histidine kinase [Frankia sp. AgB1.9]|uniref:ATP-binding protein n=1 Tax=Frankia sp. AgB1.9 TaxID=1836968 RepID=UPI0019333194|nr:ATP-binding protein [Frankia sp. AgB1.9]MBL7487930.1 sensor histidine kinase [Frankia sp. AgW1.1]MBL7549996.1 sensor histidine kinase [Frankia sp. AgB1.9]MBL7621426.1 sensor histidine kinase [Frankia sp. AgB1.8]
MPWRTHSPLVARGGDRSWGSRDDEVDEELIAMPRVHQSARRRADHAAPAAGGFGLPGGGRNALLTALLVVALAALVAVVAAPSPRRPVVGAAVAVGLLAAAVVVAVALRQAAGLRRLTDRLAVLDTQVEHQSGAAAQLADDTLPKVVALLRDGVSVDEALASVERPADPVGARIMRTLAEEVGRGERMRAAAMAACANAAGRVQALATSMLADLRDMEDRHGEEVLGDLLRLDHSTAQTGRLADSIAVLTGARSGRRWTRPIVMESILRGALSRISAYQRVRLHSTSTVAVAGYAAEGVMHALAELMDNATSFSPPSEEVHVYVEEVQAGVVVTVEDGGLVMGPAALRRAERAVSATEPLDLTTLSGTRLGLAVVGVLARKHGLTVSFRPSSRGGTGVVVIIPRQLITQPRPEAPRPPGAAKQAPRAAETTELARVADRPSAAAAQAAAAELPARAGASSRPGASDPLPKRGRGQTLANSGRPLAPPAPAAPTPGRAASSAASAGARFGAFQQATRPRTAPDGQPAAETPAAGLPAAGLPAAGLPAADSAGGVVPAGGASTGDDSSR